MKTPKEIKSDLSSFTGTEHYYRHMLGIKYTDGIKYLCDECQCYWFIDLISSYQLLHRIKIEPFQVFSLKVNPDKTATVTITDGNHHVLDTQELEFTDFPLDEIDVWCIDKVILLPSEY